MTIRNASAGDVEQLADLAHEHRIRQQGWDPEFWAMSPSARQLYPMLLHLLLERTAGVSLVSESRGRIDGYLFASAAPNPRDEKRHLWVVDDLGVSSPKSWHTVGPALLAAAAARGRDGVAAAMVVACPHHDHDRALMLIASGFTANCWFRTRRIDDRRGNTPATDDDGSTDLPLPHLHGLTAEMAGAALVDVAGGGGLLSGSIAPDALSGHVATTALADPVVATGREATIRLLGELEARCRARGDATLMVACGPGEPMLDDVLDERGYTRPVDWHLLPW